MTVIATDVTRQSNLLKSEYEAELAYCRDVVVVNDTAGTLAIGTVLGKVTATGKYKRAVETAVDGSKVAAAIVIDVKYVANATDTKVLVLVKGPATISRAGLVLDATYNDSTKKGVVDATLTSLGIQILEAA